MSGHGLGAQRGLLPPGGRCGVVWNATTHPLVPGGLRPTLPPMRWRRWAIGVLGVVTILLLAAWLALPRIVAGVVNRELPRDFGDGVCAQRVLVGAVDPVDLQLSLPRSWVLARVQEQGHAVPWWASPLLRPGLTATGRWRNAELAADFAWAVTLTRAETPRLDAALPAAWVNRRLAEASRSHPDDAIRWTYALAPGSTATVAEPALVSDTRVVWRVPTAATGTMTAWLGDASCTVAVDELTGVIELIATRAAGAGADDWQFHGDVTIATCRHRVLECNSDLLRLAATNLSGVLELVLTERLSAENMRDLTLPEGFPLDLIGELVLTDAPLPPLAAANDATPRPPVPLPPGSRP